MHDQPAAWVAAALRRIEEARPVPAVETFERVRHARDRMAAERRARKTEAVRAILTRQPFNPDDTTIREAA